MKLLPIAFSVALALSSPGLMAQADATPTPAAPPSSSPASASLAGPEALTISVYSLGFTGPAYVGYAGVAGALMVTAEQAGVITALWDRLLNESLAETGDSRQKRLAPEQSQHFTAELQNILTPEQFDTIVKVNSLIRDFVASNPETNAHALFLKPEARQDFHALLEGSLTPEQMENVRIFAR